MTYKKSPPRKFPRKKLCKKTVAGKSTNKNKNKESVFKYPNPKDYKLKYNFDVPKWKLEDESRSYERLTLGDLGKLLNLSMDEHDNFFHRHPVYRKLKLLSICLCQGGALHYIDGKTGIRDFDVFFFFDNNTPIRYPFRRRGFADFGESKFGKTKSNQDPPPTKMAKAKGKVIDVMGRQIPNIDDDYVKSLQTYLKKGLASENDSSTPYRLAQKAVVTLWPTEDLGKVIWPKKQ
jgi:hypothetical protein